MNRQDKIIKIIEYTIKYDSDKRYFEDAIKKNYYKNHTIHNINMILMDYIILDKTSN